MTATTFLTAIGEPETTLSVESGDAPDLQANAHIHIPPNFSAFRTVAQAVQLASEQNVRLLGASNYYDYSVYREFAEKAVTAGIFPIFGLEIITLDTDLQQAGIKVNDPGNPGKFYVCGKGITHFDPLTAEAEMLLATIRQSDAARMEQMATALQTVFGDRGFSTTLNADGIRARVAQRTERPAETVFLQERHLAQAFQEEIFAGTTLENRAAILEQLLGVPAKGDVNDAANIQAEIRSRLMKAGQPAFIAETFVDFDHAYRLILALGGIPCYPTLADGANPICGFETPVAELIAGIRERKLICAELIPIRNQPDVLKEYVVAMRQAGLFVTAGTEHNTLDMLPIEPTCVKGQAIPPEVQAIFDEGVCVLAAHQYLTANGKTGFVDENGNLNPAYVSDEERITAFAQLGASVIKQFQR